VLVTAVVTLGAVALSRETRSSDLTDGAPAARDPYPATADAAGRAAGRQRTPRR
jgi:hypothetical protein